MKGGHPSIFESSTHLARSMSRQSSRTFPTECMVSYWHRSGIDAVYVRNSCRHVTVKTPSTRICIAP